ncbi:MAG: MATE family efflux transporter [Prevotella sp.]|nr:MATE family efflux transporter [Prevotella sp.]MBR1428260.1 MATE family efflux transporter [Prevotella sp.]
MNSDRRSSLVKKNIAFSFLIKGWSGVVQLLIVPLSLQCLSNYEYGIWLTINSLLVGLSYMDIGLGNGLRNKLAEAMAINDKDHARVLVSTTFVLQFVIAAIIISLALCAIMNSDLYGIMNVSPDRVPNLKMIVTLSVVITIMTFVFKFVENVYFGLQLSSIAHLLTVLGQTFSLIGIFLLSRRGGASLLSVVIIYTLCPLIVYILAYPFTFLIKYRFLTPSPRQFSNSEVPSLFSLGISFFFLQMASLVLFFSSNIIISRLLSPEAVTPYQVSYRYFSIFSMVFAVISTPLWAAVADAYAKNDMSWIRNAGKRIMQVLGVGILILIAMLLFSPVFYKIWVGDSVLIDHVLSALMAIYTFVISFSSCFSNMIYGTGKIRLIVYLTILEAIIFIPAAIWLGKAMGLYGILLALIGSTLICAIGNFIQFNKIVSGTARNIWNK